MQSRKDELRITQDIVQDIVLGAELVRKLENTPVRRFALFPG